MKRIYLRVIETEKTGKTDSEIITDIKNLFDNLTKIEWEYYPKGNNNSGFSICGHIPDNLDFESCLLEIKKLNYSFII